MTEDEIIQFVAGLPGVDVLTASEAPGAPEIADHQADVDYTEIGAVIPHPVYAKQAWVRILNPGIQTGDKVLALLAEAHGRSCARHRSS